ncbi:J domain-containing protein [Desulfovermiculus halophilus]|uniref:J domain-containing protein n=1 Tax=Desulfovermiculus halophilus TaxID=339722 RepID=UPI000483A71C|nr:J domain-containing protein [Desulfovermiculus halophilus]
MFLTTDTSPQPLGDLRPRQCQCCGRVMDRGRVRYCSRTCKERFVFKLAWFNNLLRVVETRYATFFFTEAYLVLNVLPRYSQEVSTYLFPRLPGRWPEQDMDGMIFSLGDIWWGHKKRTKSGKRASRHVLTQGRTRVVGQASVQPVVQETAPSVGKQLRILKMRTSDLMHSTDAEERLKKAFRRAALTHHPDSGGDAAAFRKVYAAYQEILAWLERPAYQTRRGVPGQWCYVAGRSSWLTPL